MKALLALEDGTVFEGRSVGAQGRTIGEVVFNTGMTGYQEILTDPSYAGQIVTLTYPLIGNYGVNTEDIESRRVQVEGFIVRQVEENPSNWRCGQTIDSFLEDKGVVAIQGVDTRALTRRLRGYGVMMGGISTVDTAEQLLDRVRNAPSYAGVDFVRKVTTEQPYQWPFEGEPKHEISLLDCGVKYNILRELAALGCRTTVYPCTASADEVLSNNPDGVMLSPGPGDPSLLGYAVNTVKQLAGKKPMMGVCLGNQLVGCAFGGTTFKLKFGHRGSNHPVRDNQTGKVYITSQNHGFAIDPESISGGLEVAHVNLNDGTVEGLRHKDMPLFTIQYHPEASPGPHDSSYFFRQFVEMIETGAHPANS
jgi:carbamoyl-phosphate synthase small subunit